MFSKETTKLFDNLQYAGKPPAAEINLTQTAGSNKSQICLFLTCTNNKWRANFLATGGVALLASCEYWAMQFHPDNKNVTIKVDEMMRALKLERKWQSDVFLVVQAANKLQQQWDGT